MVRAFKQLYPVRELARIIDFHFGKLEKMLYRLDDIDRLVRENKDLVFQTADANRHGLNQLHRQMEAEAARVKSQVAAWSEESARDHAAVLDGMAFLVENLRAREEQAALERLASQQVGTNLMGSMSEAAASASQATRIVEALRDELRGSRADARVEHAGLRATIDALRGELRATQASAAKEGATAAVAASQRLAEDLAALRAELSTLKLETAEQLERAEAAHERRMVKLLADLDQSKARVQPTPLSPSPQPGFADPEVDLLLYLRPLLPSSVALDIGANRGGISERLLKGGYAVYAFEPHPDTFSALQAKLGGQLGFHAFPVALGSADATMDLHVVTDRSADHCWPPADLFHTLEPHTMPDKLEFTGTIPVEVRSLGSLRRAGIIPAEAGIVKVDTEGHDLEVLRGLGELQPAVVMAEFWDRQMIFGRSGANNRLDDLVDYMRGRKFPWHIVIYRLDGKPTSYYCNYEESVNGSWGNVLFFRDKTVFQEALDWCRAVLPVTHF